MSISTAEQSRRTVFLLHYRAAFFPRETHCSVRSVSFLQESHSLWLRITCKHRAQSITGKVYWRPEGGTCPKKLFNVARLVICSPLSSVTSHRERTVASHREREPAGWGALRTGDQSGLAATLPRGQRLPRPGRADLAIAPTSGTLSSAWATNERLRTLPPVSGDFKPQPLCPCFPLREKRLISIKQINTFMWKNGKQAVCFRQ